MQRNCVKCGTLFDRRYCPACKKIAVAQYRAANGEKLSDAAKKYRAAHRAKENAKAAKWRAENPQKARAVSEKYRASHLEKELNRSRISSAKWRAEHPELVKVKNARWRANNPEAKRINEQNRNARKRKNGGVLSKGLMEKLFKLQKGKCPCCGELLGKDYHIDHRMPIALGGANEDWNMQLLRKRCNIQKHAKHPVDFMQSRGFLV